MKFYFICLFLWILLEQISDLSSSQDFQYIQRLEGESLDIICKAQQRKPSLLYLRRFAHSQEVLNISEGGDMRAGTEKRIIIAQLDPYTVIVTLSNLRHIDTGLYVCEFLSENQYDQPLANINILLLVKAAGEPCSCDGHSLVIYIISLGVYLLLLSSIAFCAAHYKKLYGRPELQLTIPIYEDMSGSRANLHHIYSQVPETAASVWANRMNILRHHSSLKTTD